MTQEEKLRLLEDMFEMEEGTLRPGTPLDEMDEWDSLAKLSLIVLIDDACGKSLTSDDIREFTTIADILGYMG